MDYTSSSLEALYAITKYFRENRNKILDFIGNDHNLTSGEYREILIRDVLEKYVPENFCVSRGVVTYRYPQRASMQQEVENYILDEIQSNRNYASNRNYVLDETQNNHRRTLYFSEHPVSSISSGQIDIIITDAEKPILISGGDMKVVAPDAVRAVAEVKTDFRPRRFESVVNKFASRIQGIRFHAELLGERTCWAGLFVYGPIRDLSPNNHEVILSALQRATRGNPHRVIDCVAIGNETFVHFWPNARRDVNGYRDGPAWHSYHLRNLAQPYFVTNMIFNLYPDNQNEMIYFPLPDGKETYRKYFIPLESDVVEAFK